VRILEVREMMTSSLHGAGSFWQTYSC
jgi:hypothetical protein